MKHVTETLSVSTRQRCEMIDITHRVEEVVARAGISSGTVIVTCPHTTAAITINENADPSVVHDVLLTLGELVPEHRPGYRHSEGNSDAHVKSSMLGCTETVIVEGGRMALGTWQGIYFCEFDGPRSRKVRVYCGGNRTFAGNLQSRSRLSKASTSIQGASVEGLNNLNAAEMATPRKCAKKWRGCGSVWGGKRDPTLASPRSMVKLY